MKKTHLKKTILIPLTIAFSVLLVAFIYNIYQDRYRDISSGLSKRLESVAALFEKQLISDSHLMEATIEMLSINPQIQAAWLAKDRQALLKLTSPILSRLNTKHRITHFYFHGASRENFLRVYNPNKYGDIINRFSVMKAEKTGKTAIGLELGHLGTFTLRVVFPWWVDGKLTGYIEMGEEINHILGKLSQIFGVELYVSIYKKFLDRQKWESGMKLFGRKGRWEEFPTSVIVSQTLDTVPNEVFQTLFSEYGHEYMQTIDDIDLFLENRIYRIGFIPIFDIADHEVGDIEVLFDITEQTASARNSIIAISGVCVAVGLALFILFSLILGRVEVELNRHRQKHEEMVEERTEEIKMINVQLKLEISKREQAEQAQKEANNKLEIKIRMRTNDLEKNNKELRAEIAERRLAEEKLKVSREELRNLSAHLQTIREDERTSIAREIHDELGQIFTALYMKVSDLTLESPQDKETLVEKVQSIAELVSYSEETVQRISSSLRPAMLDDLGIESTLEWHAEQFQDNMGIKCNIAFDTEDIELNKDKATVIYRIFQEALTNVARHADATLVETNLVACDGGLILITKDNGKGISDEQLHSYKSLGIIGMRERAQFVGGKMEIIGVENKGTILTTTIPL